MDGTTVLFDPGIYSFESDIFDINNLSRLDYIAITHEHADHFHMPFVELLLGKFPGAKVVTTPAVESQLTGKVDVSSQSAGLFQLFEAPHEKLPTGMGDPPQNTGIHFAEVLSHPGDSHSFNETRKILAMPMTAPWGSMTGAMAKIKALKPEFVIPIHDWHWKPEVAQGMYQRFREPLKELGIVFLIPVDGQAVEINLS